VSANVPVEQSLVDAMFVHLDGVTLSTGHTLHTGFDCGELRFVAMRGDTRVRTFAVTLAEVAHPDDGATG
jgi:hypothetical protein